MTMNVNLSNRRGVGATEEAGSAQPAQTQQPTNANRPGPRAEPSVIVDRGPSEQARRLDRISGQGQCSAPRASTARASEAQIEDYRRALSQGRTPAAPPAPPALPTISPQQIVTTVAANLPANHPLRAALSQVAWQDSNRPPITDWINRSVIPLIEGQVGASTARHIAAEIARIAFPDYTGGGVGHHAAVHAGRDGFEHTIAHMLEHHGHMRGATATTAANHINTAIMVIDSAIMTGRELVNLARGQYTPTAAIVDAQRAQEINNARVGFDDGVRAAVHGGADCARMANDRVYAMGVDAGARYRREHGAAFDATSRHNEAMTVARQRNLSSVNADVRPLTAGPERGPGDIVNDALTRAVVEER